MTSRLFVRLLLTQLTLILSLEMVGLGISLIMWKMFPVNFRFTLLILILVILRGKLLRFLRTLICGLVSIVLNLLVMILVRFFVRATMTILEKSRFFIVVFVFMKLKYMRALIIFLIISLTMLLLMRKDVFVILMP